jgi:PKD repeat protein
MMRCAATARRATLHGMIWAIAAGLLAVACSDSSTPKVDPPPLAGLTHPEMARVGDAVAFASASVVGLTDGVAEHPLTRFRFTFADGTSVVDQAQATTTHTFAAAGSYAVALTITDSRGLTSTVQSTIHIVADYTATCTEGSSDGCSSGLCSGEVCAVVACTGDAICKFSGAQGNPTCEAGLCARTELPPLPDVWVDPDAYDTADDATATDAADDATPTDVEDASDVESLADAITPVDTEDADSWSAPDGTWIEL